MGFPEQEIVVTATVKEADDGRDRHRDRGRAGREPDHPQRRGRARARADGLARPQADPRIRAMLSERQQRILNLVVDSYLESGKPVGSAAIAEHADVEWGPSTVRAELAALEREGFLTHPHTSAGRVPTDSGYRFYADALLVAGAKPGPRQRHARPLADAARDRGGAARDGLDALADDRPARGRHRRRRRRPRACTGSRRCSLQPRVVMVVVIASNGAVTKRVFNFERAGRPGPGRVGLELSQRAALGPRARRADDRRPPRRPRARARPSAASWSRSATPSRASSRRRRVGPLRRGRGAAALRRARARPAAGRLADARARAAGEPARGAALDPRRALGVHVDRRREPGAGAALGEHGRRQLRARLPQPRQRSASSGRCGWTTRPRSPRCARRRASSRASSSRSTMS